jgi:hypothetical protein
LKLRLRGRSAAQGKAQAQACELEVKLISSSRENFSQKIDLLLNSTIIFNLEFHYYWLFQTTYTKTSKK